METRFYSYPMYGFSLKSLFFVDIRWTPDPHTEKYYNTSPYAYCLNNPINAIDPDGRAVWFIPLIKGAVGAAADAAVQVSVSRASGMTWGEAVANIDYSSVVASGIVSAITLPGTSATVKGVTTTATGVKAGIQTGVKAAAITIDAAVDVKYSENGEFQTQHIFGSGDNNKPIGDFFTDFVTGGMGVAGTNQLKPVTHSNFKNLLKNEFIEAGKNGLQEGLVGSSGVLDAGIKEKLEADRLEEKLRY